MSNNIYQNSYSPSEHFSKHLLNHLFNLFESFPQNVFFSYSSISIHFSRSCDYKHRLCIHSVQIYLQLTDNLIALFPQPCLWLGYCNVVNTLYGLSANVREDRIGNFIPHTFSSDVKHLLKHYLGNCIMVSELGYCHSK